jgi:hypothetical protein
LENLKGLARTVYVSRPHSEVRASLTKALSDWGQPDPLPGQFDVLFESDRQLRLRGDYDYRVNFSDLGNPVIAKGLWEFCLRETPWDELHFKELDRLRVTVKDFTH